MGMGKRNSRRECGTRSPSKRDHSGGRVGQAGTASIFREDGGMSSGVRVCTLCEDHTSASHLDAEEPCTGEATIMMCADTKKDVHIAVEIHYNTSRHEQRLVERGLARVAGQSCLAGPSVPPAAPRLRVPPCMGVW
jgi:hypothetical protein